jgi:hypothetical protein
MIRSSACRQGTKKKNAGTRPAFRCLFHFARTLLAITLARQSFFGTPLFAWLEIEGVTLDFFYDVFLLHFSFEAPQGAFKRLSILQMDFRQSNSPPSNVELLL